NLNVENGFFQYPDLPQPVKNIGITLKVDNPDGITDHTVVDISKGHIEFGNDPIDFNLLIKTPVSNLYFEGRAKGKFNLANAAQFTTLEPGTSVSGTLTADVSFRGNKSSIDKKEYDKINTSGTLNLAGLNYASKAYPDGIKVEEAAFTFNPKNITLNTAKATFLQTHYTASGSVDNAIGYALKDEPIAGNLNVHADNIDLNKLMGVSSDSSEAQNKSTTSSEPFKVPNNV